MAGERTGTSDRVLYGLIALAVVLSPVTTSIT